MTQEQLKEVLKANERLVQVKKVLTEYDRNGEVKCVKAEYVDGKMIKEDTSYALINGEFVEIKQTMKYFVDPNKIKC